MQKQQKSPKSRAKRHAELKKQAFQQHPGIKEILEVYNHWTVAHSVEQLHQAIENPIHKASCSNSTDPNSFL